MSSNYEASLSDISLQREELSQNIQEAFRKVAQDVRGNIYNCVLGDVLIGGYNICQIITFDDGLEWIVKTPARFIGEATKNRMDSEIATLKFLAKIGTVPVPRIHDYSVSKSNPAKRPYIIMDKVPGITLLEALHDGLDPILVDKTLEDLARFRKILQKYPFNEAGSLVLDGDDSDDDDTYEPSESGAESKKPDEDDFFIANLINKSSADLEIYEYRGSVFYNSLGYYVDQYNLSLITSSFRRESHKEMEKMWMIHSYLGSLLPSYAEETKVFYLAHTDLSISNLLIDPSDGHVTGIIDWEFANALPPQAVEHYPSFLSEKRRFIKRYGKTFVDAEGIWNDWRVHYAKQFEDD